MVLKLRSYAYIYFIFTKERERERVKQTYFYFVTIGLFSKTLTFGEYVDNDEIIHNFKRFIWLYNSTWFKEPSAVCTTFICSIQMNYYFNCKFSETEVEMQIQGRMNKITSVRSLNVTYPTYHDHV